MSPQYCIHNTKGQRRNYSGFGLPTQQLEKHDKIRKKNVWHVTQYLENKKINFFSLVQLVLERVQLQL